MAYSDPVNTKILTFLNRAQTKIGQVSILVANKVSEDARYETYKDEAETAYGLISFTKSLDNNFNDWTEAEIVKFIDIWTAKANLNAVPYFEHSSYNLNIVFSSRDGSYLPYGKIFIGGSDNVSVAKYMSGDATMDPNGVVTIANEVIDNDNIAPGAGIEYSKLAIADGDLTIAKTSGLQGELDGKVDENAPISGATKTKITYDAKGLVTSGGDATTADIADSSNKRYVTDSDLVVLSNTSNTNSGNETLATTGATLETAAADTPVDADTFHFWQSVGSILKKVSWTTIKATLKTYFDTIYQPISSSVYATTTVSIGDWNMDSTVSLGVAHGIADYTKIRSISVVVRDDNDASYFTFDAFSATGGAVWGGVLSFSSTQVFIARTTGESFDAALFDATSYNRGWITITYEV